MLDGLLRAAANANEDAVGGDGSVDKPLFLNFRRQRLRQQTDASLFGRRESFPRCSSVDSLDVVHLQKREVMDVVDLELLYDLGLAYFLNFPDEFSLRA